MAGGRWDGVAVIVLMAYIAPASCAYMERRSPGVVAPRHQAATPVADDGYPGPDPLTTTPTIPAVWTYPVELSAADVARSATAKLVRFGTLPADAVIVSAADVYDRQRGGITPWVRPDGVVGYLVDILYSGRITLSLPGSDGVPHAFARVTVDRVSGSPFAFESGDDLADFGEE